MFFLPYSPHKFTLFTKMPLVFFSFRNDIFTLSTSSSSCIYKIVVAINTSTTMNNQFEALNVPQIDLHFFFLNSYQLKTTFLSLYLHIGSRLFEILGAWKKLMCAKQVISLVEIMKLRFFPDLFVQTTYR